MMKLLTESPLKSELNAKISLKLKFFLIMYEAHFKYFPVLDFPIVLQNLQFILFCFRK